MDNYLIGEFLLIIGFIISLAAQIYVNVSYRKYKNIENSKGLTGFDVARKILDPGSPDVGEGQDHPP